MRIRSIAVSLALASVPWLTASHADQHIRTFTQIQFFSNSISGDGSAFSSLNPGGASESILNVIGDYGGRNGTFSFNIGARNTNDPTIDPTTNSITALQMRVSDGIRTLNLGDTYESFSQYSLDTGLKGLSLKLRPDTFGAPEISFVAGYAYPRWDNFNPSRATRAMERRAIGLNARKQFTRFFSAGLSLLRSTDSDRVTAADPLYDMSSVTLNWEYKPLPNVSIRGESSVADGDVSLQSTLPDQTTSGSAHRITFEGRAENKKLTAEYERVSPRFVSTLGYAVPDREKFKLRWREKRGSDQAVRYGLVWYRDSLSNNKAFGTNHYKPEIGLSFDRAFNRPTASLDFLVKVDCSIGGGTKDTNTFWNVGYLDQLGTLNTSLNLGINDYDNPGLANRREFVYNLRIGTNSKRGGTFLQPSINIGGSSIDDEFMATPNRVFETSLGLALNVPKHKLRTSFKFGRNKLDANSTRQEIDSGSSSAKWFGVVTVYYKPDWLAKYTPGTFYFRTFINSYDYLDNSFDFRETSFTVGVTNEY